jgi:hypothetical protein
MSGVSPEQITSGCNFHSFFRINSLQIFELIFWQYWQNHGYPHDKNWSIDGYYSPLSFPNSIYYFAIFNEAIKFKSNFLHFLNQYFFLPKILYFDNSFPFGWPVKIFLFKKFLDIVNSSFDTSAQDEYEYANLFSYKFNLLWRSIKIMLRQQIMMQLFGLLCCATFYFSYS